MGRIFKFIFDLDLKCDKRDNNMWSCEIHPSGWAFSCAVTDTDVTHLFYSLLPTSLFYSTTLIFCI